MQTLVVELVTEVDPSPVVDTVGVKEPPKVPEAGRLEMDGVVGVDLMDGWVITDTVLSEMLGT